MNECLHCLQYIHRHAKFNQTRYTFALQMLINLYRAKQLQTIVFHQETVNQRISWIIKLQRTTRLNKYRVLNRIYDKRSAYYIIIVCYHYADVFGEFGDVELGVDVASGTFLSLIDTRAESAP